MKKSNTFIPLKPDGLSGLEYLTRMMQGKEVLPPMCETIPMRFIEVKEGLIRMSAIADERHVNTINGVHGGFAATVIDSVTGCVVHTMLEADIKYTTISLELKMLRPPPLNEEMIAEGTIINISKRLAVANGVIRNAQNKIVAQGTGTCMIFR